VSTPSQAAIATAGAIEPLVALVRRGTDDAKEMAARALLCLLLNNPDNQVAMLGLNTDIYPLIKLAE